MNEGILMEEDFEYLFRGEYFLIKYFVIMDMFCIFIVRYSSY